MADTLTPGAVAGLPAARPVTPATILARDLVGVYHDIRRVPGLDGDIVDRLRRACDLAAGLEPYLAAMTTPESPALADLAQQTRTRAWSGGLEQEMLSGHVEGTLLKFLVRMTGASRVLEIGMFTGYSALAMAEAVADDGIVVACEIDSSAAELARRCFEHSAAGARVRIEVGPAIDTLRILAEQVRADAGLAFDFVFLDADKSGYWAYLDYLLDSGLLRDGGIVAVDNTLMQGEPYVPGGAKSANGAAIAAFNAAVAADPRVEQVLIPVRDGLTLVRAVGSPSRQ